MPGYVEHPEEADDLTGGRLLLAQALVLLTIWVPSGVVWGLYGLLPGLAAVVGLNALAFLGFWVWTRLRTRARASS